jgi:signal transduction histidine kinase
MLNRAPPVSLSRIIATRMVLASLLVSGLLAVFFFARYALDTQYLRTRVLLREAAGIASDLADSADPASRPYFQRFPNAYAFRVYSDRLASRRRVLAQANANLLPPLPTEADGHPIDLQEELVALPLSGNRYSRQLWVLTHRERADRHHYWVEVAMAGDPAWLWGGVMGEEMWAHVLLPVLAIVPALTLVMLFAVRHALRPLRRLAEQATGVRDAVSAGRPLTPLAVGGLPAEFTPLLAAINALLSKLERSLAMQKQFTANIAHELRTPLAILHLQAAELPAGPARQQITHELRDLRGLVNELLGFAQAEEALIASRDPVALGEVVRKACEDAVPIAVRRGQIVEFDEYGPPLTVPGNAALIEIAVRNILENALKYSPAHTTVTVTLDREGRIMVEDRGPGVSDQDKRRVFERFWRRGGERIAGAGVGLALVRRIAELHQGEVRLEDRQGGGTRCILALRGMVPAGTS